MIARAPVALRLPAAFLRRCVVLTLEPDDPYVDFLVKRGEAHFGRGSPAAERLDVEILRIAAAQLDADREQATKAGVSPPGLAEYIDLLTALHRLAPGKPAEQKQWLQRLAPYAFLKNGIVDGSPELSQRRAAASAALGDPAAE